MKRYSLILLVVASLMAQPIYLAAANAGQEQAAPASNAMRGSFPTTLVKSVDSKKLKDGDMIVCQTIAPLRFRGTLVPSGSKVYAHVTQSQARSKGDPQSSLALVFDKIEISKGKEIPMKGVLQAIAPPLPGSSAPETTAGPGTIASGHSGDTTTMPAPNAGSVAGPNSGVHPLNMGSGAHPILTAQTEGVLGFKNLEMDKNNVLTSSNKEVKLDSGTQMMIRAEIEIPTQ